MSTSLSGRLKDVQALLNSILEETRDGQNDAPPSHWELPLLPPPDPEGQLSSTDLLNWWFRSPRRHGDAPKWNEPAETGVDDGSPSEDARRAHAPHGPAEEVWSEISLLLPEPEEHLAEEHAQAAVDCLYDFLHAVGRRDIETAADLVHDRYHVIENGEEVDKPKFVNSLAFHFDTLRNWDFDVSLAVAPEPVNHPIGVLIHALVQFDAVNLVNGTRDGRVEERLAILREDESGALKIAALPRIAR